MEVRKATYAALLSNAQTRAQLWQPHQLPIGDIHNSFVKKLVRIRTMRYYGVSEQYYLDNLIQDKLVEGFAQRRGRTWPIQLS
jgi:hypothetical protein